MNQLTPPRGKRGPAPYRLPEGFKTDCLTESARQLGIGRDCLRKAMKRAGVPFPPKSFQAKFMLPVDFIPTTPKADADRFKVDVNTIKAAMKRQGISPHSPDARKRDPRAGWAWARENLTPEEQEAF